MLSDETVSTILELYEDKGLTTRHIAGITGVPPRTVARYLNRNGARMRAQGPVVNDRINDLEWLKAAYESGRSTTSIAKELGCSAGTVRRHLLKAGVTLRSSGAPKGHKRNSPESVRLKMSLRKRGVFEGSGNPNWKGGITRRDLDRCRYPAKAWTHSVKERDGFACVECGETSGLHAHHIKPWSKFPELRFDVGNGITLCAACHELEHKFMRIFRKQARTKPHECAAP